MVEGSLSSYHFTLILVAVITSIVAPVIVQIAKHAIANKFKKNAKEDIIVANIKQEGVVVDRLEKIRKKYNVDRVWIAVFHNGSHTFTGKSMQKFSLVYEAVKKGISSEGPNTQSLPTSLFTSLFKEIATKGIYRLKNTENYTENNSSLQSFFETRGIKSFLSVSMLNIEDKIIGILCMDSVYDVINMSNSDIETIKYEAGVIAGYLE